MVIRRSSLLAVSFATALMCACSSADRAPAEDDSHDALISDQAHGGGTPGFFFLLPLVPVPHFTGTFEPRLSPVVEIDQIDAATARTLRRVATFTSTSGVQLVPDKQVYLALWRTDDARLPVPSTYRIHVRVGPLELGFADVQLDTRPAVLWNLDRNEYMPLKDGNTLPIAFRIETTTLGALASLSLVARTETASAAWDWNTGIVLEADLVRPDGTRLEVTSAATYALDPPGIAHVSANGIVTSVAPGQVNIRASWMTLSSNDAVSLTFVIRAPDRLLALDVAPRGKIVQPGESVDLSASGSFGDRTTRAMSDGVEWSIEPGSPDGASLDPLADGRRRFTARTPGLYFVRATWPDGQVASNRVPIAIRAAGSPDVAQQTIAPAGGVVTLGALSISFPPGAFTAPQLVTVVRLGTDAPALPSPMRRASDAYLVEADDRQLAIPAHVVIAATSPGAFLTVDHGSGVEKVGAAGLLDHFSIVEEATEPTPPQSYRIDGVPFFDQGPTNWCFPTSMAMVLDFDGKLSKSRLAPRRWSIAADYAQPASDLHWIYDVHQFETYGLPSTGLWLGYGATSTPDDVKKTIELIVSSGQPAIAGSGSAAHFFTIVGYDADHAILNDSSGVVSGVSNPPRGYVAIPWSKLTALVAPPASKNLSASAVFAVKSSTTAPVSTTPKRGDADVYAVRGADGDRIVFTGQQFYAYGYPDQKSARGYYYARGAIGVDPKKKAATDRTLGETFFSGDITLSMRAWQVSSGAGALAMKVDIADPTGAQVYHRDFGPVSSSLGAALPGVPPDPITLALAVDQKRFRVSGTYHLTVAVGVPPIDCSSDQADCFVLELPFKPTTTLRGVAMDVDPASGASTPAPFAVVSVPGVVDVEGAVVGGAADASGAFSFADVVLPSDDAPLEIDAVDADDSDHGLELIELDSALVDVGGISDCGIVDIVEPPSHPSAISGRVLAVDPTDGESQTPGATPISKDDLSNGWFTLDNQTFPTDAENVAVCAVLVDPAWRASVGFDDPRTFFLYASGASFAFAGNGASSGYGPNAACVFADASGRFSIPWDSITTRDTSCIFGCVPSVNPILSVVALDFGTLCYGPISGAMAANFEVSFAGFVDVPDVSASSGAFDVGAIQIAEPLSQTRCVSSCDDALASFSWPACYSHSDASWLLEDCCFSECMCQWSRSGPTPDANAAAGFCTGHLCSAYEVAPFCR